MIILDTNVVSEPMRSRADRRVIEWLDAQAAETLFLTTISLAELLVGVAFLPDGARKTEISAALKDLLANLFGDRILAFDQPSARSYARLMSHARSAGQAIPVADGQIAAIALAHGFSVAARDAAPFRAAGVKVIDPWQAAQR
jgi:predicted nucleic acid-binding protein